MGYTVKIHKKNKVVEYKVEKGTNLLKFLTDKSDGIKAPCGGKGTCGKCRVIATGLTHELFEKEKKLLGEKAVSKWYRLACYNKINSDMEIFLDEKIESSKIVTEGIDRKISPDPVCTKEYIELKAPGIDDQKSDMERIVDSLKKAKESLSLDAYRSTPEILRSGNFKVTLVKMNKRLVAIESGDTAKKLFGTAFDVGTTTIAAYLVDLTTGKRLKTYSVLNPQKKYGADVISRIEFASSSNAALKEISTEIVNCINESISKLADMAEIKKTDVYFTVFAGNTTMIHLLLGITPQYIGKAPFIAATTSMLNFPASDLALEINPFGNVCVLPAVSGYVGADTVAAVLSSAMADKEEISLLIDIGTNGEIVLGNKKWMLACSTAAGPAFEGANIRNGIGGISGAIDHVKFNPLLCFTTINNEEAVGICGSGIVDAISGLLEKGIIDGTGRLLNADEITGSDLNELSKRLITLDGKDAFLISASDEIKNDFDIAITQRDIREIQNAKAAIAAGIKVLIDKAKIKIEDIGHVYLAGGFGSCINKTSAVRIGLLPEELEGKIQPIGNAAGLGAVEALISLKQLRKAEKIKDKIKYIELSTCKEFMDLYIDCMMFKE